MREIEVKLRVKDLAGLKNKLEFLGCELSFPIKQHDLIYTKKGDSSIWEGNKSGYVVMRLRQEDDRAIFNLKQQRSNELDSIEVETKVDKPEAIKNILAILGYEPQVEVKKIRQKGRFKDYEICLDEVEKLGAFVELEKMTDDEVDAEKIQEELLLALEFLGLSREDQETKGYDTQIYHLKN